MLKLIAERKQARENKDFKRSDEIRDELKNAVSFSKPAAGRSGRRSYRKLFSISCAVRAVNLHSYQNVLGNCPPANLKGGYLFPVVWSGSTKLLHSESVRNL